MAEFPIKMEGSITLPLNRIVCVCEFCNNHDNENAIIELNFREGKLMYLCSACRKENSVIFGKDQPAPYPRSSMRRR